MKMGRIGFAVAMASTIAGAFAIACDDSDDKSGFNDGTGDASFDSGGGFVIPTDAGNTDAPVSCSPRLAANFGYDAQSWQPANNQTAKCTDDDLGQYYDRCLARSVQGCDEFLTQKADCVKCLEPEDQSGPIQFYLDRTVRLLNTPACMAIESSERDASACPGQFNASITCQRSACMECFQRGGTFSAFSTCQNTARGSGCNGFEGKLKEACGDEFASDAASPYYDCFQHSEEPKAHALRVMGKFCK